MSTHFLYLTNSRLVSLITRGGRISARREFAVSDAGSEEFDRYLAGVAGVPVRILTDLAEEDLRADTVPHVGAKDRAAIVGRKLGQIYRGTPYRHAVLLGRETEGRRDDRVVYMALTNPEELKPWIAILEKRQAPLAGIHSAAALAANLAAELDLRYPHTLMVLFNPGEALRQVYIRAGEIYFTRLTPIDLEDGNTLGSLVAEETQRTWQYLDNLRLFGAGDQLMICVLGHAKDRPAIEPVLGESSQVRYQYVDIEQASTRLGLKPPPIGSSAEELLVKLFLKRPVENHYATPELRRYDTLRKARALVNGTSVAVLAASLAVGGWNVYRVMRSGEADQRLMLEVQNLNREYEGLTRSMPHAGVGAAAMRDAATFYTSFIQSFPTVSGFLAPLSSALAAHPQVRLTQLAWQATDDPKALPQISFAPPRVPPPVRAFSKAATEPAARPAASDDLNPAFNSGRFEVALVEALVRVPSHDFRSALTEVQRLADDIGRIKGFSAEVLESPLDVRSTLALQGKHEEREPGLMETRFVLKVVRTHEGAPA